MTCKSLIFNVALNLNCLLHCNNDDDDDDKYFMVSLAAVFNYTVSV